MTSALRLVQLSYSPWSERARWALDHHGFAYRTIEHMPFLGELRLRRIVGRGRRRTVPVLIDGATVLTESWDIVKYADRSGAGTKLIPADQEGAIREWTALADAASAEGRALVVSALRASDGALDETLPLPLPTALLPVIRPVTRFGMSWFARKYGMSTEPAEAVEARLRPTLDRLRHAVAASPYVLRGFSYADIAMATLLQGISPVGNGYIRLGSATRRAWTRPALEKEYADVIRWRDNLYATHRGRATAQPI
jgi:glutathione S-transferase